MSLTIILKGGIHFGAYAREIPRYESWVSPVHLVSEVVIAAKEKIETITKAL